MSDFVISQNEFNSCMFKDLHINPVTLKLIEKEVGKSLKHMGTGEIKSGVQNYTDSSEY